MQIVPGRFQSLVEMGLDFVRVNIAEDLLGKKDGQRFLPILTTLFFMILFFKQSQLPHVRMGIFNTRTQNCFPTEIGANQ